MNESRAEIYEFLGQRSLAVAGASRSGKKMGNAILKALKEKGYKVFPIHPEAESLDGTQCYHSLESLPEKVGGIVLCLPPIQTEKVLTEVHAAGINRVWMQQGAESYAALRFCEKNGIKVVHNQCILMFIEPVESIHKIHRWIWKLLGKYPAPGADPNTVAHP
jgi:predicted CoA-binding protein